MYYSADFIAALLVVMSILSNSTAQLFQKRAADKIIVSGSLSVWKNSEVWWSLFFLAFGFFCWVIVLRLWALSLAYPLLSLSYILVLLYSKFHFKEKVTVSRWIGVAAIILGLFFLYEGSI
jgi:undecaprenyl phosphate-alpha-L-ara4N flippase subunit ArnE